MRIEDGAAPEDTSEPRPDKLELLNKWNAEQQTARSLDEASSSSSTSSTQLSSDSDIRLNASEVFTLWSTETDAQVPSTENQGAQDDGTDDEDDDLPLSLLLTNGNGKRPPAAVPSKPKTKAQKAAAAASLANQAADQAKELDKWMAQEPPLPFQGSEEQPSPRQPAERPMPQPKPLKKAATTKAPKLLKLRPAAKKIGCTVKNYEGVKLTPTLIKDLVQLKQDNMRPAGGEHYVTEQSMDETAETLRQSDVRVIIIQREESVVGYAAFYMVREENTSPLAWILELQLAQNFRRLRLGTALVHEISLWGTEHSASTVQLLVASNNRDALSFYFSFSPCFSQISEYTEPNGDAKTLTQITLSRNVAAANAATAPDEASAPAPVALPVAPPVAVVEPVGAPVVEPVGAPVAEPVAEPDVVMSDTQSPVSPSRYLAAANAATAPDEASAPAPVAPPVAPPVAVVEPVAPPVAPPVAEPVAIRFATHVRDEESTLRTEATESDDALNQEAYLRLQQQVRITDVAIAKKGRGVVFFKVEADHGKTVGWIKGKYLQLEPVADAEDGDYPVHKILTHRGNGKRREYLVAWGGRWIGATEWLLASACAVGCAEMVDEYLSAK